MAQQNLDIYIKAVDGFSSVFDNAERRANALGNTFQKFGQTSGSREASKIGRIIEAVQDGGKDLESEYLTRRVGILQEYRTLTDEIVRIQRLGATTAAEWNNLETKRLQISKQAAEAYEKQYRQQRTEQTQAFVARLGAAVGIAELLGNRIQKIGNEYERISKWADETNASGQQIAGEFARTLPGVGSMAKAFDHIRGMSEDITGRIAEWFTGSEEKAIKIVRILQGPLSMFTGEISSYEARIMREQTDQANKDVTKFLTANERAKKMIADAVSVVDSGFDRDKRGLADKKLEEQLRIIDEARAAGKAVEGEWEGSDRQKELLRAEQAARQQHAEAVRKIQEEEVVQAEEYAQRRLEIERELQNDQHALRIEWMRLEGRSLDADLAAAEEKYRKSMEKIAETRAQILKDFNDGKSTIDERDRALREQDVDAYVTATDQLRLDRARAQREEDERRQSEADRRESESERRKRAAENAEGIIRRADMNKQEILAQLGDRRAEQALQRLRIEEKYLAFEKQLTEIMNDQALAEEMRAKARAQIAENEILKQRELAAAGKKRTDQAIEGRERLLRLNKFDANSEIGFGGGIAGIIQDRIQRLVANPALMAAAQVAPQIPGPSPAQTAPTIPAPAAAAAPQKPGLSEQDGKEMLRLLRGINDSLQTKEILYVPSGS